MKKIARKKIKKEIKDGTAREIVAKRRKTTAGRIRRPTGPGQVVIEKSLEDSDEF